MQNEYKLKVKNFFKDMNYKRKNYLLDANDEIPLEEKDNKLSWTGVYLNFTLNQVVFDLNISINIYSWGNEQQKYVDIYDSNWSEDSFGGGKYISEITKHYEIIIEKIFRYIKEFKYEWHLEQFIHQLENPIFDFHYKLLNTFTETELKSIILSNFKNYPILNICKLKNTSNFKYNDSLFQKHVINGFYLDGVEVSTDLNESNTVLIEDDMVGEIDKKSFLEKINYYNTNYEELI